MILFIIGALMVSVAFMLLLFATKDDHIKSDVVTYRPSVIIVVAVSFALSATMVSMGSKSISEQKTYIKALKHNPYEMHIRYELKDSLIYPVDTIYRLK